MMVTLFQTMITMLRNSQQAVRHGGESEEGGGLEQGEQECSGPADQVNTCFSIVGTNPGLSLIG